MFSLQFTICTHNINANVCLQIVHFLTATAAMLISSDRTHVETNSFFSQWIAGKIETAHSNGFDCSFTRLLCRDKKCARHRVTSRISVAQVHFSKMKYLILNEKYGSSERASKKQQWRNTHNCILFAIVRLFNRFCSNLSSKLHSFPFFCVFNLRVCLYGVDDVDDDGFWERICIRTVAQNTYLFIIILWLLQNANCSNWNT